MIIEGVQNIKDYLRKVHEDNLDNWYEEHQPTYVGGTRKDVWISIQRHNREKRRIKELEDEILAMKERESRVQASHEMHLAMGCDDRDCRVCR